MLAPTSGAIHAFEQLVASINVDGAGGDQHAQTSRMHMVGDRNETMVEFPESTNEQLHAISREMFGIEHVRRNFTYKELLDQVLSAATAAALVRAAEPPETHLRAAYTEVGKDPPPIQMMFRLAPFLHFSEEVVTIGDVALYRATEKVLSERWPQVMAWEDAWKEHALAELKDHMVAELAVAARPERAEEIAAERITATLGVVGMAYAQLYRDWPLAGLLPSLGAAHLRENANGSISFGPTRFFDAGLMQFPPGYLSARMRGTGPTRLGEAIAGRRDDDVSRRLLAALLWWSSGNEPGPWAMRFSRYMTAFEALLGRKSQRGQRGLTKRLAARVAAIAAPHPSRLAAISDRFIDLYNARSDTVHEGALAVEPALAYDAMALGANVISYIARSTFTDDAGFHQHLDTMTSTGAVWIDYGHLHGLDPGT